MSTLSLFNISVERVDGFEFAKRYINQSFFRLPINFESPQSVLQYVQTYPFLLHYKSLPGDIYSYISQLSLLPMQRKVMPTKISLG